ncbi:hypothetical protein I7I51_06994 [Histoplasma capsulatum]|uniref:Uncharacterized protein n=1 Tax=Ajellomyces capsulatus TaxID=5037 RepID=A0A8A1MJ76_AJECA|nr:hypothetical protein I7I51_06994 [Histoplasma capsulatum]
MITASEDIQLLQGAQRLAHQFLSVQNPLDSTELCVSSATKGIAHSIMTPHSKSANDCNITTKCRCGIVASQAMTKVELLTTISRGSDVRGSDIGKAAVTVPIPHMCSQQSMMYMASWRIVEAQDETLTQILQYLTMGCQNFSCCETKEESFSGDLISMFAGNREDDNAILISYKQPKPSNVGLIKLAPVTFGPSPIDPALHRTSPSRTRDLPNFESASAYSLPPSASHLSRPPSPSTESSSPNLRPQHQSKRDRNLSYSASLPGLSTLASVASAPSSHLRYVLLLAATGVGIGTNRAALDAPKLKPIQPAEIAYETKDKASSNQNAIRNMSYATSSPGATTGGQGNTPVSAIHEMRCSPHSRYTIWLRLPTAIFRELPV